MRLIALLVLGCSLTATAVSAQQPPAGVSWWVTAGRDTVELRDIARSGRPVDSSPVAWRGYGLGGIVQHMRSSGRRQHVFTLEASRVGDFTYVSTLRTSARPSGDRFTRVEARYEYRRYLFSNVVVRGLDLGAGLQGGLLRSTLTRHVASAIETGESRSGLTTAFVLAVRYQRASRLTLDLQWANGLHLARATERHSASAAASRSRWGGGWLTDLSAGAAIGVTRRTALALRYGQYDDGQMSSHRGLVTRRHLFTIGVVHAR